MEVLFILEMIYIISFQMVEVKYILELTNKQIPNASKSLNYCTKRITVKLKKIFG